MRSEPLGEPQIASQPALDLPVHLTLQRIRNPLPGPTRGPTKTPVFREPSALAAGGPGNTATTKSQQPRKNHRYCGWLGNGCGC